MMNKELLEKLSVITEEEKDILAGRTEVNRELYYAPESPHSRADTDTIDSARILRNGRLIDIRPHVRFIHFPKHRHNFVEFIYMCQGSTTHIVDGVTIELKEGDLLFLNQHAEQEILPASEQDIAVNFMILPSFFDTTLRMLEGEDNALRDFLISCLTSSDRENNYLYFAAAQILPVQNLIENLIWTMLNPEPNRRLLMQTTMGLLFLHLMNFTDRIQVPHGSYEDGVMLRLLSYIDTSYQHASLSEFAADNKLDIYTVSRIIKKNAGRTFTDLLQEKRLTQAAYLLRNTPLTVDDISYSVGYDNTSFFHRLFKKAYGVSPRTYRQNAGK